MKYINALIALSLLSLTTVGQAEEQPEAPALPTSFYVVSWNVENLFDTTDDPNNPYDDEFLPSNPDTKWTAARLETKLNNLGRVIAEMNFGQGPDILGLQEVEHEHLVAKLMKRAGRKNYGVAYAESPDRRGIDTCVAYNSDMFSLVAQKSHVVTLKYNKTTRDVFHAELKDKGGRSIHVFVNHWPSRSKGARQTRPKRYAAARVLSKAIANVFEANPDAYVIAMGDFNDEPSDRSLRRVLKGSRFPSRKGYDPTTIYNLSARTAAAKNGSLHSRHDRKNPWKMYDQLLVSGTLVNGSNIEYESGSFKVIQHKYMLEKEGSRKGAPMRTYGRNSHYIGGYSDHLPVGARFGYSSVSKD